MQQARLPQYRIEIKVSLATHIQRHECSHSRRTAKKKQIAATSRKGLEPRRRSGVGFGQGSDAGDSRRMGSGELDWMEFPKGRTALDIDCIRGECWCFLTGAFRPVSVFLFLLSFFVFCSLPLILTWMIPTVCISCGQSGSRCFLTLPYLTLPYLTHQPYYTLLYNKLV